MIKRLRQLIFGQARNPMDQSTRETIALTAFLAWIGLGADGLSSSCYGPQEAFRVLQGHPYLGLYLAVAIAVTVFIISFAYNQVIELFPNGGGGYKVATKLLGKNFGVVAGAALIVDYIMTIVMSIAQGTNSIFSFLPVTWQPYKMTVDNLLILALVILNLRGMKESVKVLMPIFVGFVLIHLILIVYGFAAHGAALPHLLRHAVVQTHTEFRSLGIVFMCAIFLHAYSLGSGTYTGLEAVSNNVNTLAEPRVKTGKWTMLYMAVSLSLVAGGLIILYMLYHVHGGAEHKTYNAVLFESILGHSFFSKPILILTLLLEAGLLFVGANTGFLGGPAVLSNMALDNWVPNRFRNLSNRLVTQNGIVLFGLAAFLILHATNGSIDYVVVLYSLNVFLAFMLSILGLCVYWWPQMGKQKRARRRFILSLVGFLICFLVFCTVIISKFTEGALVGLLITCAVIFLCAVIRRHYRLFNRKLKKIDRLFTRASLPEIRTIPTFNATEPTAVFFVGKSRGIAMHTILWVQRLFPNHFRNFVFVSIGVVDTQSYGGDTALDRMKSKVDMTLEYFVDFSHANGIAASSLCAFSTDPVDKMIEIAQHIYKQMPQAIFFASQVVLDYDNWLTRSLHNDTAFTVQRKLYLDGIKMVIMPMKVAMQHEDD